MHFAYWLKSWAEIIVRKTKGHRAVNGFAAPSSQYLYTAITLSKQLVLNNQVPEDLKNVQSNLLKSIYYPNIDA